MKHRSSRRGKSLLAQTAELAVAAPQVVAHRVTRMVMAGPTLSERDRREFTLMVEEKRTAFTEACQAMSVHAAQVQQELSASWLRSVMSPASWGHPEASRLAAELHSAAADVLATGLDPVHRKAVANAKRLARTRLR